MCASARYVFYVIKEPGNNVTYQFSCYTHTLSATIRSCVAQWKRVVVRLVLYNLQHVLKKAATTVGNVWMHLVNNTVAACKAQWLVKHVVVPCKARSGTL